MRNTKQKTFKVGNWRGILCEREMKVQLFFAEFSSNRALGAAFKERRTGGR